MRRIVSTGWLGVALFAYADVLSAQVAEGIGGIVSPTPAGLAACLAVEIAADQGQQLTALRWYNNDGTRPFAKLAFVGGAPGGPPVLGSDAAEYLAVTGASNAWSEIAFEGGISTATGALYAVFVFPVASIRTGIGAGTGAGIGYRADGGGLPAYLSADGQEWARLHPAFGLAVEAIFGATTGTTLLASRPPAGAPAVVEPRTAEGEKHVTALFPVRPNPSNPAVTIVFSLAEPGQVRVAIYNLRGALVLQLASGVLAGGQHEVVWRGTDERGGPVASGVYVVRMETDGGVSRQRLTLVR